MDDPINPIQSSSGWKLKIKASFDGAFHKTLKILRFGERNEMDLMGS